MAWIVEYNNTLRIVDVALNGSVSGPEVHELTSRAIGLLKKQGTLEVLVDTTEMEWAPPIVDIYSLPGQYETEALDRRVRIALVAPKSSVAKQATQFYENACTNRGWLVRSFASRDEAIAWLTDANFSNKPEGGGAI